MHEKKYALAVIARIARRALLLVLASWGLLLASDVFASCGSAFCAVNSNWATEGAATYAGDSFDLRYEDLDQSQPRAGSRKVGVGQIPHDHDEVSTRNRNVVATFNRTFESGWGFSVIAPLVDRDHVHIHNDSTGQIPERWKFTEPGDVRALGRYQFAVPDTANESVGGLRFGIKLPTGRKNIVNADGDVAERSLQPGTGTVDGIVGAYFHQAMHDADAAWFVQTQFQRALKSNQQFKPGSQFGVDLGYRQGVTEKLAGIVQLNFIVKGRDRGAAAEPADSGGRSVFVSPGVSYSMSDRLSIYAFYQQPIYQHVNGVQLTAKNAFVVGLSGNF